MKTYAESKGKEPFDWNEFLSHDIEWYLDKKNSNHINAACLLARDWATCACGNQCAIIPRYNKEAIHVSGYMIKKGTPKDDHLQRWGSDFYGKILILDDLSSCPTSEINLNMRRYLAYIKETIHEARFILNNIEYRSDQIIKEIQANEGE